MYLNLSFYFNLYATFKSTCALYHLTVVIVSPLTPTTQRACYFPFPLFRTHAHHFPSKLVKEIAPFRPFCTISCAIPRPFVIHHTTCLSAHPSVYFALQLFPSTFFTLCLLCLLTTQTKLHVPNT